MYFNAESNAWSKQAPQDVPAPPGTGAGAAAAAPPGGASGGARAEEEKYALGPFARAVKQPTPAPAPTSAAPVSSATAANSAGQVKWLAGPRHLRAINRLAADQPLAQQNPWA